MKASALRGTKIKDATPEELAALSERAFELSRGLQESLEGFKAAYLAVAALGIDPVEVLDSRCPPPSPR